jgi:NTE family protein
MHYFDSRDMPLTIKHVMALGRAAAGLSRRPYRRPALLGRRHSLKHQSKRCLTNNPRRSSLIFALHMWVPNGPEPDSLWNVLARQKDFQYANRSASHIARQKQLHKLRHVITELAAKLPSDVADTDGKRDTPTRGVC